MSALAVVAGRTSGGVPFYYKGESGREWLGDHAREALEMPVAEAEQVAAKLNADYLLVGLRFFVESDGAPGAHLVYSTESNWDIYLMPSGNLEALPNARGRRAGAVRAAYGNRGHLLSLMRDGYFNEANYRRFTEAGLEYMEGLSCSIEPKGLVYFC